MAQQGKEQLRQMQMAYIGKLMANISHEFKNHLAIIRETSGLLEDLLMLEKNADATNRERYGKIFSGITDRIDQAAEMCRHLSKFSHRMDTPLSSFSVPDLLQEEIYLLQRLARQKQVEMNLSCDENLPAIYNDPALLQFAFYCVISTALENLETGGCVSLTIREVGQKGVLEIIFSIEGAAKKSDISNEWQKLLPEILSLLQAELTRTSPRKGVEDFIIRLSSAPNQS
jgi:signal transduction histidine kinase